MNKKKLIETIAKYFASYIGTVVGFWILYWVILWSLYGIANASHSGSIMNWLAERNFFDAARKSDLYNDYNRVVGYETGDSSPSMAVGFDEKEIAKGVEYLEREIWRKKEMDTIPCLVGLFDELNKFDLDNLKKRESLIESSPILEEIVSALTNVPMASLNPPYLRVPDDHRITPRFYLRKIRDMGDNVKYDSMNGFRARVSKWKR